ncbi:MAG: alpha-galactosidase [Rikenellaceae bacterium]|nr:alpha-galactosidase [Rikenellaceae bacterium]
MKKIYPILLVFALIVSCTSRQPQAVKPPLMGWSSWNAYMVDISDSIIIHQADLIVERGLKDAGYGNVNIDDGFFGYRDQRGYMIPHPQRFPGGSAQMRSISDHIHSLGLKAGIYSDAGDNTCGSSYNKDLNGIGAGLWMHDVQDADQYFNNWNFDFIKIDYCGGIHRSLEERDRYEEIRQVIDSVAGRHIDINVCRWDHPGTWVEKIADSWRISGDIRPVWSSVRYIVEKNLYLSAYAHDGHYNDMDMLAVGYNIKPSPFWEDGLGLSYAEEEAHFGMWCIMSSPLLLGCDIEYIPDETMRIITNPELIAVNQDPLGLQAHVVQHEGETYVFAKDILRRHGGARAVALYNPSDSAASFSVPADVLEFAGEMKVRDLNLRSDLASCRVIEMTLQPHTAKILKVEGKRIEPVLYEAEWGYCPDFTAIRGMGVKYIPVEGASGRAVATNLGDSPTNYLEWADVFSRKGGKYRISVRFTSPEAVDFDLVVNGKAHHASVATTDSAFVEIPFEVEFLKGENDVRISGVTSSNVALDCLKVTKL